MESTAELMREVAKAIEEMELSAGEAAKQIGVTTASLARHLDMEYVRSDSLAKYKRWLKGEVLHEVETYEAIVAAEPRTVDPLIEALSKPLVPHRVVDLFSGCGGLSLGFELAGGGGVFSTVLAIDIEEPMVRVFNQNHPHPSGAIGKQTDLSQFLNEAEVLAYYLEHLAVIEADTVLHKRLDELKPFGLANLVASVTSCDKTFLDRLTTVRSSDFFAASYKEIAKTSLSQTSVLGFHSALKLPQPGINAPSLGALLWGELHSPEAGDAAPCHAPPEELLEAERHSACDEWNVELSKLRERAEGSGTGQLASAAGKIRSALMLIEGPAYEQIKQAWVDWRAERSALRRLFFEDAAVLGQLRDIYESDYQADVLLGGPPCQGFSRIGRGKIRSLREQSVHVHTNAQAGDNRNELMHQYVLFVAALAPRTFLFENVRHFQADVKTPEGTFSATDVLAEAISSISQDGLEYLVHSEVIHATRHLVPQTRERFFMVGVRSDLASSEAEDVAKWCLTLPQYDPVPLKAALAGLPEPAFGSGPSLNGSAGTATHVAIEDLHVHGKGPVGSYLEWIRQPSSSSSDETMGVVDGHCTRDTRQDDRAFFSYLGPGKRWMDYRCDESEIIGDLRKCLEHLSEDYSEGAIEGVDAARLQKLVQALDGSLVLRLLLEKIQLAPGEDHHHLASPNYLKKREGNHGDWLARMDAELPSKTMVSHMGKDTYAYVHPSSPRTISVREAARIQSFPDWFEFGSVGLVDGYRIIGNAVPPLLSNQFATRIALLFESVVTKKTS